MYKILLMTTFVMLLLIIFVNYIHAEEGFIFSIEDPLRDDFGPGTYYYPGNETFEPYYGLFDIIKFELVALKDYYLFKLYFDSLNDPWASKYGFSLPLIEIYIDNAKGGSTEVFREGANVSFDPRHPWDKLLKLTGWWIRLYTPDDNKENIIGLDFNDEEISGNVKNCEIETKDNQIELKIKKDLLGPLINSYMYILVGGFDPFGLDHFRGINNKEDSWKFYDPDLSDSKLIHAPRVIDIILPENYNQEKVLSKYEQSFAVVYPVSIKTDKYIMKTNLLLLIAIVIILGIIIFMNRDKFINNNF